MKTLKEIIESQVEPERFLVKGMLNFPGISIMVAKPKVGKSVFARQLSYSVSRGEAFLGQEVMKGGVVYVCLEDTEHTIRNHFLGMGADGGEDVSFHFSMSEDDFDSIENLIEIRKPKLVVLDTLFKAVEATTINSYTKMAQLFDDLKEIAHRQECHILAIHHHSKGEKEDGEEILGSQAILGSVDTAITLRRFGTNTFMTTKQRSIEPVVDVQLDFAKDSKTFSMSPVGTDFEEDEVVEEQEVLGVEKFYTANEAAEFLCLSVKTVYALVCHKRIGYRKAGSRVLFTKRDLEDFLVVSEKLIPPANLTREKRTSPEKKVRNQRIAELYDKGVIYKDIAAEVGLSPRRIVSLIQNIRRERLLEAKKQEAM